MRALIINEYCLIYNLNNLTASSSAICGLVHGRCYHGLGSVAENSVFDVQSTLRIRVFKRPSEFIKLDGLLSNSCQVCDHFSISPEARRPSSLHIV